VDDDDEDVDGSPFVPKTGTFASGGADGADSLAKMNAYAPLPAALHNIKTASYSTGAESLETETASASPTQH
jgi:hypothetical protein